MTYSMRLGNLEPRSYFEMEGRPGEIFNLCGFAHVKDHLYGVDELCILVVKPNTMVSMMIIWSEALGKYELVPADAKVNVVAPTPD